MFKLFGLFVFVAILLIAFFTFGRSQHDLSFCTGHTFFYEVSTENIRGNPNKYAPAKGNDIVLWDACHDKKINLTHNTGDTAFVNPKWSSDNKQILYTYFEDGSTIGGEGKKGSINLSDFGLNPPQPRAEKPQIFGYTENLIIDPNNPPDPDDKKVRDAVKQKANLFSPPPQYFYGQGNQYKDSVDKKYIAYTHYFEESGDSMSAFRAASLIEQQDKCSAGGYNIPIYVGDYATKESSFVDKGAIVSWVQHALIYSNCYDQLPTKHRYFLYTADTKKTQELSQINDTNEIFSTFLMSDSKNAFFKQSKGATPGSSQQFVKILEFTPSQGFSDITAKLFDDSSGLKGQLFVTKNDSTQFYILDRTSNKLSTYATETGEKKEVYDFNKISNFTIPSTFQFQSVKIENGYLLFIDKYLINTQTNTTLSNAVTAGVWNN